MSRKRAASSSPILAAASTTCNHVVPVVSGSKLSTRFTELLQRSQEVQSEFRGIFSEIYEPFVQQYRSGVTQAMPVASCRSDPRHRMGTLAGVQCRFYWDWVERDFAALLRGESFEVFSAKVKQGGKRPSMQDSLRLTFGHVVAHGLYGILENACLTGDQISREGCRGSGAPLGSGMAKALGSQGIRALRCCTQVATRIFPARSHSAPKREGTRTQRRRKPMLVRLREEDRVLLDARAEARGMCLVTYASVLL